MTTVLVVEDEEALRVLAESCVQELGYQTLSAGTPTEALAVLAEHSADILFTDISLGNDFEAGLKLGKAAVEIKPDLAVLYTTGRGITDGMSALFVEKSGYLAKPYTVDQFGTALQNLIQRK
jgi:DNA-binding NtrC family response regulator